jgi:hypothetical protein
LKKPILTGRTLSSGEEMMRMDEEQDEMDVEIRSATRKGLELEMEMVSTNDEEG